MIIGKEVSGVSPYLAGVSICRLHTQLAVWAHTQTTPPHIYTSPIRQDELISSCYILQVLEKADRNKVTLEISPSRNCPENGKYKHLTYAR